MDFRTSPPSVIMSRESPAVELYKLSPASVATRTASKRLLRPVTFVRVIYSELGWSRLRKLLSSVLSSLASTRVWCPVSRPRSSAGHGSQSLPHHVPTTRCVLQCRQPPGPGSDGLNVGCVKDATAHTWWNSSLARVLLGIPVWHFPSSTSSSEDASLSADASLPSGEQAGSFAVGYSVSVSEWS